MAKKDKTSLGFICTDLGFCTQDDLKFALEHQKEAKSMGLTIPLGELLVATSIITRDQKYDALRAQRRRRGKDANSAKSITENIFGQLAIKANLITKKQLKEALKKQSSSEITGKPRRLGEIFVEMNLISEGDVRSLLSQQRTIITVCPACATPLSIAGIPMGTRMKCNNCGEPFDVKSSEEPMSGDLPRYELGEEIADGKSTKVCIAYDSRLRRTVAMIRLKDKAQNDLPARVRLMRDARIQGSLHHPCILPIHDLWADDLGRPFVIRQLIQGESFKDKKKSDKDPFTYIRAVLDTARALELAHDRGVAHRSISTDAILIGDHGGAYLTNWDLAADRGNFDYIEEEAKEDIQLLGKILAGITNCPKDIRAFGKEINVKGMHAEEMVAGLRNLLYQSSA